MGPFDNWKARCSSLGKITGDYKNQITEKQIETLKEYRAKPKLTDKQKEDYEKLLLKLNGPKELPDTCTSYLKEVYNQEVRKFRTEIISKYLDRGKFGEQDGINMLQQTLFHNINFPLKKNTERVENDFISGEHDVLVGAVVVDIKMVWDWKTFDSAELTNLYHYQLQGYMALNKCSNAILFYCLSSMPDFMMAEEERKLFYTRKWGSMDDEGYLKACEELREMYDFNSFPVYERFKPFQIERSEEMIAKIYTRVVECRKWLNSYHLEQIAFHEVNKELMGFKEVAA